MYLSSVGIHYIFNEIHKGVKYKYVLICHMTLAIAKPQRSNLADSNTRPFAADHESS